MVSPVTGSVSLMTCVKFLIGLEVLVSSQATPKNPIVNKPNIVFFIVDDLGWGNVGYHRNPESETTGKATRRQIHDEIVTEAIDRFAKERGLELNRHYVHGTCTPTRSSFFSGRLPTHVQTSLAGPEEPHSGVPRHMTTLPRLLKDKAGYTSHMIGKWDAGFASMDHTPSGRGFDTSLIYTEHGGDYWTYKVDPRVAVCNYYPGFEDFDDMWMHGQYGRFGEESDSGSGDIYEGPVGDKLDDPEEGRKFIEYLFRDRAVQFLEDYGEKKRRGEENRPFFLMYAPHLMHQPLQIPEEEIISPSDVFPSDHWVCSYATVYANSNRHDARKFGCRQLYLSMVKMMDKMFEKLMDTLDEQELWEDTLVVFTSDNGGSTWLYESGASNYPLRGGKYSDFEGGIRGVSFVTGGVLEAMGRATETENGIIHVADWYATFLTLAGLSRDDYLESEENIERYGYRQVDSKNVWDVIANGASSPREEIYVSNETIIQNEFKYIIQDDLMTNAGHATPLYPTNVTVFDSKSVYDGILDCSSGCLFNVVDDPGEAFDLSNDPNNEDLIGSLHSKLEGYRGTFFTNSDGHEADSCPSDCVGLCPNDAVECALSHGAELNMELTGEGRGCVPCGCWMSKNYWGGNVGPFQDIENPPECTSGTVPTCPEAKSTHHTQQHAEL